MASYIYMQNLNEISQVIFSMPFLGYCLERKYGDTDNVLLLGVYGYLYVQHLSMASYINMQNLNEISQVIFIILYGQIKNLNSTLIF